MNPHLLTRSWRLARVASAALALTAASLTVSGAATSGAVPQASPADAGARAGVPCLTTGSAQRLRAGSGEAVDPNDVSLAQTRQAEAKLDARLQQRGLSVGRVALPSTTIDVYVHVIERNSGSGGVSKSRIKKQISVLNQAYAGKTSSASTASPFTFELKKIDHTRKSSWYHWTGPTETSDGDDLAPKTALHRGGPEDLNLYLASLDDDLLGYSSFPFDTTLAKDGVVVLNATVPGGKATSYNKGDTVTHEVGHWLGLYHTFQNGCTSPGDVVDDTPYQADGKEKFFCNDSDTCRSAGKDPVHNFMSYGNDKCLDRFSSGQVARMVGVWQAYRAPSTTG
ncbi:MAG: zinc metalloprotease [Janthinobacterium lividum]